jgi:alcohol dehydrogenase class IV
MTIEQQVRQKLRELPSEKKKEVLDFVDSLAQENGLPKKLRGLEGIWEDLNIEITDEDIAQARREMWGNSPRDIS